MEQEQFITSFIALHVRLGNDLLNSIVCKLESWHFVKERDILCNNTEIVWLSYL